MGRATMCSSWCATRMAIWSRFRRRSSTADLAVPSANGPTRSARSIAGAQPFREAERTMPGTNRMLRILGLFALEPPVITPEQLIDEFGGSRASVYRALGQLSRAGMLERVADRGYVLEHAG